MNLPTLWRKGLPGCGLILAAALLAANVDPAPRSAGHVYYQRLAAPALDRYTNSPDSAQQKWFRTHFYRMGVFSPYFDAKSSWYPDAVVYVNLYGVDSGTSILKEHPEWILHDGRGRMLYIPFACAKGSCARYAGDVASAGFRQWWIQQMKIVLGRGRYRGLWIDDVNMEFRVGNGTGEEEAPIDSTTGKRMSWDAWRGHIASFTEDIRRAFPDSEIVQNPIWFAGPQPGRDDDSAIKRQIRTADNINIERGIATDQGLTGGTGEWSLNALFGYIDRVHAAGPGVTLGEYDLDDRSREYSLAGYFLISNGNDRIGDGNSYPENWWRGWDVDLGEPTGPRAYNNGIYRRSFSRGMVLLGEPGAAPQTVRLPSEFTTLSGMKITSAMISPKQGMVLINPDNSPVSTTK
jgi:hypothetical protein